MRKMLGYVMLVTACLAWVAIPVLPFLGISLAAIATFTTVLIITGEVTFFAGVFLLGKEVWQKIKAACGIGRPKDTEQEPEQK
jgi:hypothetical protein